MRWRLFALLAVSQIHLTTHGFGPVASLMAWRFLGSLGSHTPVLPESDAGRFKVTFDEASSEATTTRLSSTLNLSLSELDENSWEVDSDVLVFDGGSSSNIRDFDLPNAEVTCFMVRAEKKL